jgi:hypothetical protein
MLWGARGRTNRQLLIFDKAYRVYDLSGGLKRRLEFGTCQSFRIIEDRIRLFVSHAQGQ